MRPDSLSSSATSQRFVTLPLPVEFAGGTRDQQRSAKLSPLRGTPHFDSAPERLSADVELRFEANPSPFEPPLADFNPPGTGLRNSYGLIFSTRSEGSLRALPALHTGTPPKAAHRYDSAETEARRHIKLPKLFLSSLAT